MSDVNDTWLQSQTAVRALFAIITIKNTSGVIQPDIYISTAGYITKDSAVRFLPIMSNNFNITEKLSIQSGGASMSFGDIEIDNLNGEYDSWLTDYIWKNGKIQVYFGDPLWTPANNITAFKSTYELIFDGVIEDIDSKSRTVLNIKIRDKLQRLNTPIETPEGAPDNRYNKVQAVGVWTAAGGQNNQDTMRPIIFGEVHNVEPVLLDPSNIEYIVNNGPTEQLIELRDNGVPIYNPTTLSSGVSTYNSNTGIFRLSKPLYGTLTASVQGLKETVNLTTGAIEVGYTNRIAKLICLIISKYINSANKFTAADLDLTNLQAFDAAHTQPVGLHVGDRENALSVCQMLADSVGAQLFITRAGKLQLLKLATPASATFTITDDDILYQSLEISERPEVVAAVKIGYNKNYTIQSGLLSGIPEAHKTMFASEWDPVTSTDATVKANYQLNVDPVQKDTFLQVKSDAETEASRLLNYYKVPKTVFKFNARSRLMSLTLGQNVTLVHKRFGLYNNGSGKLGQVVSLSPNWLKSTVTVEVIV